MRMTTTITSQEKLLGRKGFAVVLVLVLLIGSTECNLNLAKNVAKPLKTLSNKTSTLLLPSYY